MLVITQLSKREELHSHNGINKISSVKEEEGTEEVILITLLMINSIGHLFKSQMQKLSDKNFNNKKSNMAAGIGKNLMGSVIKQQANAADKQAKELEE